MLLTDARRAARTGPDGELIPLDEQDRSRWDGAAIAEGVAPDGRAQRRDRGGDGPRPSVGLARLEELASDPRLAGHHRLDAVRAHLLARAGELGGAIAGYRRAAERTTSVPEWSYLLERAARLGETGRQR